MKSQVPVLLWLAMAASTLCLGCNSGPPKPDEYPASGTVTLDGQPLKEANVTFVPMDGIGGAYGAEVVDGKFHLELSPGEKNVAISSYRFSETLKGPDGKPGPEQYLPDRYNKKSELKVTISKSAENQLNFELTSKP